MFNNIINAVLVVAAMSATLCTTAQISELDNNSGDITDYVGWDNFSPIPLTIQHEGNFPINWHIDDEQRMQLEFDETVTINGFNVDHGGFLGLSEAPNFFTTGNGPYSLLHLHGENFNDPPQGGGFRPWMRIGMTVTSNKDLMYVGHKANTDEFGDPVSDDTDAVIAWTDNTAGGFGPDNMRFIFATGSGTGGGASHLEGLEVMRLAPSGNVGIGNFSITGLDEQPTQRLDLAGNARIRALPLSTDPDIVVTGVEATEGIDGDYILRYTPAADLLQCDWNIVNAGADLAMGYTGACVEGNVGIGVIPAPNVRLDMFKDVPTSGSDEIGQRLIMNGGTFFNHGILVRMDGAPALANFGVESRTGSSLRDFAGWFESSGIQISTGVFACGGDASVWNFGVYGRGTGSAGGTLNIGVYGDNFVQGGQSSGQNFAGYFAGDVAIDGAISATAPPLFTSDATLKTNVEDVANALELVNALEPKSYNFLCEEHPDLNLEDGNCYGFLAQDMAEVLPDLVGTITVLPKIDSAGVALGEIQEFSGISYTELVPILTAAMKEQQTMIDELNDLVADLSEIVGDCCSDFKSAEGSESQSDLWVNPTNSELLQNAPNPFTTTTKIGFKLGCDCQVTLKVYDSSGKQIAILLDEQRNNGTHSFEWTPNNLSPGVYFYSLEVDGFEQVRRAVKM